HRGVRSSLLEYGSRPPTCAEVFACARKGDEPALHIIRRAARVLGAAIAGLAHVFDPEVVILSGQMAESGDLLVDIVRNEVGYRTRFLLRREMPIVKSQLPQPSGALGAAALAAAAVAAHAARGAQHPG
ncbi:MAG: ROK family protein, partial [Terriglobia bacterium]